MSAWFSAFVELFSDRDHTRTNAGTSVDKITGGALNGGDKNQFEKLI